MEAKHTNRLSRETSPYLLQHAHNPVDWYPWGEEAFVRARAEDKPVLLSVGYSACHWCHVMERESFEDDETARMMNEHFVNVKVDREERPDIDSIYMAAVQALTRHGGWPMNVFLTLDGGRHARGRVSGRRVAWPRGWRPSLSARQTLWGLRRRPQVPPGDEPGGLAPSLPSYRREVRARRCGAHVPADGERRHLRPARWRLLPLLRGRLLARPALREDALRQRPPLEALPRGVPGHRRHFLPPHRRGDARLRPARHDERGRGFLLRRGRRLRGRGGEVLRLDARRAGGRPRP